MNAGTMPANGCLSKYGKLDPAPPAALIAWFQSRECAGGEIGSKDACLERAYVDLPDSAIAISIQAPTLSTDLKRGGLPWPPYCFQS